jgi:hypothetical protein
MTATVNGFNLEVTDADGLPHVRVSLANGTVIVDTDQVSVCGLERLSEVFAVAAKMAYKNQQRKSIGSDPRY